MAQALEGLFFGLASGPACLASCLPVLLPWLAARHERSQPVLRLLSQFLAGRLGGYLIFAVLAWMLGLLLPESARSRSLISGVVQLGVAILLILDARKPVQACLACGGCGTQIRTDVRLPVVLGLLTGLNLCPPFVAAGLRAADGRSLAACLFFFVLFYIGTTLWMLPLAGVRWLPRSPALLFISRATIWMLAAYFAYLGVVALAGAFLHGQ